MSWQPKEKSVNMYLLLLLHFNNISLSSLYKTGGQKDIEPA